MDEAPLTGLYFFPPQHPRPQLPKPQHPKPPPQAAEPQHPEPPTALPLNRFQYYLDGIVYNRDNLRFR